MRCDLDKLKKLFNDQDSCVLLGYSSGINAYSTVPAVFKDSESLNRAELSYFCSHNLTTYLLDTVKQYLRAKECVTKKVMILVKPCDGKNLVELFRENQLSREDLVIVSLPCEGMIDTKKIQALKERRTEKITDVNITDGKIIIQFGDRKICKDFAELVENKCLKCTLKAAPIYDHLLGEANPPTQTTATEEETKNLSPEELRAYWNKEYARCIRCGACKKVCPLCYCSDCVLERDNPKLAGDENCCKDNGIYLMIRAMHLAGRCTGCGRCTAVCPASIDHTKFHQPVNQYVEKTFDFKSGQVDDASPVFSTAKMHEKADFPEKIKE